MLLLAANFTNFCCVREVTRWNPRKEQKCSFSFRSVRKCIVSVEACFREIRDPAERSWDKYTEKKIRVPTFGSFSDLYDM